MSKYNLSVGGLLLAAFITLAPSAQAAQPGFYAGLGLGQAHVQSLDQNSGASKLFAGFNVNPFLGLELAYVNLGNNYQNAGYNMSADGGSFDLIGYLPITPYVNLFARGGIYNWTISDAYSYYSYSTGSSNDYGFGLSTEVSPRLWMRGEYQKFQDVAGSDVNLITVSLAYHF